MKKYEITLLTGEVIPIDADSYTGAVMASGHECHEIKSVMEMK